MSFFAHLRKRKKRNGLVNSFSFPPFPKGQVQKKYRNLPPFSLKKFLYERNENEVTSSQNGKSKRSAKWVDNLIAFLNRWIDPVTHKMLLGWRRKYSLVQRTLHFLQQQQLKHSLVGAKILSPPPPPPPRCVMERKNTVGLSVPFPPCATS